MTPQPELAASRSIELFRDLAMLSLSGSQALLRCQIEQAQKLLERNGERLRATWSDAAGASPEQWQQTLQSGVRDALDATRECMLAATTVQKESLRLIEAQAAEAKTLLSDALAEAPAVAWLTAAAPGDENTGRSRRVTRTRDVEHRRAA